MERPEVMRAMQTSISEVLETMFFLPVRFYEGVGLEVLGDITDLVISRVTFGGPFQGRMMIFIPRDLARSITASFLGKDEAGVSHEHLEETVKEIDNMIAGNTFTVLDEKSVFNLGIPQLVDYNDVKNELDPEQGIVVPINTPDGALVVWMNIDS
ncbi:MAG: chemotaxis protein CheX [Deltaproteobacteria bacterium]|nr:chemotaxis protein CheX [Deltaproteobacteria bacterium]